MKKQDKENTFKTLVRQAMATKGVNFDSLAEGMGMRASTISTHVSNNCFPADKIPILAGRLDLSEETLCATDVKILQNSKARITNSDDFTNLLPLINLIARLDCAKLTASEFNWFIQVTETLGFLPSETVAMEMLVKRREMKRTDVPIL